jgi:hypothetical protein
MKLRCPRPEKAKENGCLDITEDGRCNRKEWSSVSFFKESGSGGQTRAEVYCDRIKTLLREQ